MDIPMDFITATGTRLILVKLKLAVCKPRWDQKQGLPIGANYRKACQEILQYACALRHSGKGQKWLWLFQTYVEWDALAYLLLNLCMTPSGECTVISWQAVDESYNYWKNDPDVQLDHRWAHIEEFRSQALSIHDRTQITDQAATRASRLRSQPSPEPHEMSEARVNTILLYETESSSPLRTADKSIPQALNFVEIAQQCPSFRAETLNLEPNCITDKVPLTSTHAYMAVASLKDSDTSNIGEMASVDTL
ncbi:hypothetical protein PT974_05182 [Cladobotryum mycophilum]|uniref:Uncharacterized protein n=1 Tax=Cladobotryum mycophilum TaxID=491253 RepID=A0ABR0SQ64_9HYPO